MNAATRIRTEDITGSLTFNVANREILTFIKPSFDTSPRSTVRAYTFFSFAIGLRREMSKLRLKKRKKKRWFLNTKQKHIGCTISETNESPGRSFGARHSV